MRQSACVEEGPNNRGLGMGDKDCRKVSAVKNGRIMQTRMQRHSLKAGTSHHETDNSKARIWRPEELLPTRTAFVRQARAKTLPVSVHCTPWKWIESFRKSNAFSMSGLRHCGLTNVVTYNWTSFYCMATVAPPMTPPQK
uniref:HTH CENPB-type domain-containing protein n=1 Tax=Trichuris muris TaxID=70415 RepID=A0A5S6Q1T4_TRIMR